MADIKTVLNYDDMVKAISQPDVRFVVDVRNADEVANTGMIPSSINIPLDSLTDVLCCMSEEEFRHKFQRHKPTVDDEIIFYCQSGRRASKALDTALKLGFTNSKTYAGSWKEWSEKR